MSKPKFLLLVGAVLLGILGYLVYSSPQTPEHATDETLNALAQGDVEKLCRLADPEELKITRLSPAMLNTFFNDVWDQRSQIHSLKYRNIWYSPSKDTFSSEVYSKSSKSGRIAIVSIHNNSRNRWHLNLSWLIFSMYVDKYGSDGSKKFYVAAKEAGMKGFRSQSGRYNEPQFFGKLANESEPPTR